VVALTSEQATARAEAEVRAYCGWHLAPSKTETITLDGTGTNVLLLPSLHVTDLVSITEDGTLADAESYQWSSSGVVRRGSSGSSWRPAWGQTWTGALRGIVVEFTHGYDEMPMDLQAVVEQMSSRAQELSEASQVLSQVGQVRYAVGVDGLRQTGLLAEGDRQVLDRYRLPKRP
jgi:hypothetical protein